MTSDARLKALLAARGPFIDLRAPLEFAAGAVPGAVNLPLLARRPGAFNYAKPIREWRATWPAVSSGVAVAGSDMAVGVGVAGLLPALQASMANSRASTTMVNLDLFFSI